MWGVERKVAPCHTHFATFFCLNHPAYGGPRPFERELPTPLCCCSVEVVGRAFPSLAGSSHPGNTRPASTSLIWPCWVFVPGFHEDELGQRQGARGPASGARLGLWGRGRAPPAV